MFYTGRTSEATIRATTSTNMTVSAGTTIKLGCETDTGSRIRWNFNSPRLLHAFALYNGFEVHRNAPTRISVNATDDRNELIVPNVNTNDSGVYSCHELEKFSRNVLFYVTVKGTLASEIISDCVIHFQIQRYLR